MDQITLSLLVTLAMSLFRWGLAEIQKKEQDKRKKALAVGAMVAGAGFFAWMIFFRTLDTVAGATIYVMGRRLFSRSSH